MSKLSKGKGVLAPAKDKYYRDLKYGDRFHRAPIKDNDVDIEEKLY